MLANHYIYRNIGCTLSVKALISDTVQRKSITIARRRLNSKEKEKQCAGLSENNPVYNQLIGFY